jgi:hypothetical protein
MKARLRFHLAKGSNFMKWQYTATNGAKQYVDPTILRTFQDGKLKNQRATAEKIKNGANKTVCAWIEFKTDVFSLQNNFEESDLINFVKVYYNPRKLPYWHDAEGNNLDNSEGFIAVIEKQIYLLKK